MKLNEVLNARSANVKTIIKHLLMTEREIESNRREQSVEFN